MALVLGVLAWGGLADGVRAASTLDVVRERGHVLCGVAENRIGLSAVNSSGRWHGLEVEFCGALAAGILGDRAAVKFRPISPSEGPRVLANNEVDVLLGGTAWTFSREADLPMRAAGVLFVDGQSLMVQRAFGVTSALELSGASICVHKITGAEQAIVDFFAAREMKFQLVVAEKWDELVKLYADGKCTLLTGDLSVLAIERANMSRPNDHIMLPELVTQELISPMVRQFDEQWFTVVRWTLLALIEAEELGLSSENIAERATRTADRVRRFIGADGALGASLGLSQDWAMQIVQQVGNYGEIYHKTLGDGSRLRLSRGLNNLASKGGLMVSPSFR